MGLIRAAQSLVIQNINHCNRPPADINECILNSDDCAHICTNTIGSYHCICRTGYRLAADRHTCEGICHKVL